MPPAKYYIKDTVIRFNKGNFESIVRCFFYSVITLRFLKTVRIDQESVPGTDVWFPVPKGDDFSAAQEKNVKDFVDSVLRGKVALPESGTLVVTKFSTTNYFITTHREEYERWHFNFQTDSFVDQEQLSKQLFSVVQELSNLSVTDGQQNAPEDTVQFDVKFAS